MGKKIINIFLGSAIVGHESERLQLVEFIRNLSDQFEDGYDIKIKPIVGKGEGSALGDGEAGLIRQSEMCYFIFFDTATEIACAEFETAYAALQANGAPKVYVYFKNLPEDLPADPSLEKFRDRVRNEIKHYPCNFNEIDTVKLYMVLNLRLQEFNLKKLNVECRNGSFFADGKPLESINMGNVSEFKNNSGLNELRAEFDEVQQKYLSMRPLYDERKDDEEFYKEYADVAARRKSLMDQIEETEKAIFAFSLGVCENVNKGGMTPRQERAYRYFEHGDLERANAELDDEVMSWELKKLLSNNDAGTKQAAVLIREYKTKIYIVAAMTKCGGRFEYIESLYDAIIPVVLRSGEEIDIVFDYAEFLDDQRKLNKVAELYNKIEAFYTLRKELVTKENTVRLYFGFGGIYYDLRDYKKAKQYYFKAVTIYSEFAKGNTLQAKYDLACCYDNIGNSYAHLDDYKNAERYYNGASEIYYELANEDPLTYCCGLANNLIYIGSLYSILKNYAKAEEKYLNAIAIFEELVNQDPSVYNADLAMSYNNAGELYTDLQEYDKAERYCLKAIAICKDLVVENPSAYRPRLARYYSSIALLYSDLQRYDKAEDYFLKSTAIYEEYAEETPLAYNHSLAINYKNIGIFYEEDIGDNYKAMDYYLKAVLLYMELCSQNHGLYCKEFEQVGDWYVNICSEIVNDVEEQIKLKNPDYLVEDFQKLCGRLALIYRAFGEDKKAEEYRKKAEVYNTEE